MSDKKVIFLLEIDKEYFEELRQKTGLKASDEGLIETIVGQIMGWTTWTLPKICVRLLGLQTPEQKIETRFVKNE